MLVVIGVEPLLSRATNTEELFGAHDLYLLGFAHCGCVDDARRRLEGLEIELPDDLLPLRATPDSSQLPLLDAPPALDRCPFCGNDAVTQEHVIPQWLSRLLTERGGLIDKASGHGPRRLTKVDRTAPCCDDCNHEWLSVLENDVSPILAPMVRGEDTRRLEPTEQRLLALWALKTAMLLDLTGGRPTIPSGFFHAIRQKREPFESSIVDVGAYLDSSWAVWVAPPQGLHIDVADTEPPNAVVVTMLVGRALFQVIISFSRGTLSVDDQRVYGDALTRIWPATVSPVDWPRNGLAFSDNLLELLAEGITGKAPEEATSD